MVGESDFPLIFPVKSDSFFACNSGLVHELSHLGSFFKDFFYMLELGTKDIFYYKKRLMSQMVGEWWFCHSQSQVVEVSMG